MKCNGCGVSVEYTPLFRNNAKAEPGVWKCESCGGRPVNAEVGRLVDVIAEREKPDPGTARE